MAEVAKALEIREHTLGRWRNQYCGMKADDAKELRRLRNENGRLKRPRSGAPATRCPQLIRSDNGPELIAAAIKDWCRWAGTGTAYIEPGSPWQNPFVESFNGKARDELFAREIFDSVFEARVLYHDWCHVYNRLRPHSSLGYQPPEVFAAR